MAFVYYAKKTTTEARSAETEYLRGRGLLHNTCTLAPVHTIFFPHLNKFAYVTVFGSVLTGFTTMVG